jgi:fructose-1,6-bisphosphatase
MTNEGLLQNIFETFVDIVNDDTIRKDLYTEMINIFKNYDDNITFDHCLEIDSVLDDVLVKAGVIESIAESLDVEEEDDLDSWDDQDNSRFL